MDMAKVCLIVLLGQFAVHTRIVSQYYGIRRESEGSRGNASAVYAEQMDRCLQHTKQAYKLDLVQK